MHVSAWCWMFASHPHGLSGFLHVFGIESFGLTLCSALAGAVADDAET